VRTARAEITDRVLIVSKRHLRAILDGYAARYDQHRPHRARNLRSPDSDEIPQPSPPTSRRPDAGGGRPWAD
jgi:hypothetical protein